MRDRGLDRLYQVAEPQGGYFTTRGAGEVGVSTRVLSHYVAVGDLERVAHGVYRLVRFPAHQFGDAIAATLWAGRGSVVSHDSALAVYGLGAAMPVVVHLTVPCPFRGRRAGVVVNIAPLRPDEVTVWEDVPVTGVERTLADVATQIDPALAGEASREAIRRGLTSPEQIAAHLGDGPEAARLRRVLGAENATVAP